MLPSKPNSRIEQYLEVIVENMSTEEVIDYIKTINGLKPNANGELALQGSSIPCTDSAGYNKGNLHNYIDFLCNTVKIQSATITTLDGRVTALESRVTTLEQPPVTQTK